jgi:hypothetical protein
MVRDVHARIKATNTPEPPHSDTPKPPANPAGAPAK